MAAALPPQPPQSAIVITGTALPNSKSEKVYDVELISRRQIAQSPRHEIDQLLKDIPGVQLFRRSDARSGHPTSQGVTLRALGGNASSRALLVLDGVPQTDPFGGWVNWPAYDPSDLSEIRVIRGGGSVTNGPGALAGTIEMTSRVDTGESGALDVGSRASVEERGRIGLPLGGSVITVSGRGERSDGFIPITASTRGPADKPAPYDEWSGRGRWIAPLGDSTELQANLDGFHDWRTRGTLFSSDRTNGSDASLRVVGRGEWQWSALGYWQWRNLRSSTASVSDGRLSASRVLLQDSVPSQGVGGSIELRPPMPAGIELRLGADTRLTTGATHELATFVEEEPTKRRVAGGQTWTAGGFAEATADIASLTLTAGARIDHWQVSNGHLFERQIATGELTRDEQFPQRQGWLPTARGGILKKLGGGFSLRSAAYLGWRMPTLNELFRPFRAGSDATAANPDLKPERLAGVEAGVQYANGPFNLSLTAFLNRLKDAIANVTLGEGPGTFPEVGFVGAGGVFRQRQNVDAVKVRGLEASAGWSSGPWAIRAGASLTHARMEGSGAAEFLNGLRPAETPNFAGSLSASWQDDRRGAEIVLNRIGGQYDDDLNLDLLKPATTLDAFLSWPITRRLQLVARGENLTDTVVEAGINGDGSIERATPRTLWIGVRLSAGH